MGILELSVQAISQAVINIRRSKLPDPARIGNAGSFFKNPIIPQAQFEKLQTGFPGIVGYPSSMDTVKIAAGWLIEQAVAPRKQKVIEITRLGEITEHLPLIDANSNRLDDTLGTELGEGGEGTVHGSFEMAFTERIDAGAHIDGFVRVMDGQHVDVWGL